MHPRCNGHTSPEPVDVLGKENEIPYGYHTIMR
jgi:hypothetical protein